MILSVPDVTFSGCESVSFTANEKVPNCVGVPVITPLAGFNDSPGGRAPVASDHVTKRKTRNQDGCTRIGIPSARPISQDGAFNMRSQ